MVVSKKSSNFASANEGSPLVRIFCGNSSVGRAQPCQGWGRGFESRFPLADKESGISRFFCIKDKYFINVCRPDGGMVDTKDLKSFGHYGCAGSSPAPGTENSADNRKIVGTIFF